MSRSPNVPEISLLKAALLEVNNERGYLDEHTEKLAHEELCVAQSTERLKKSMGEVKRLMESMDCHAPGNFGYDNRMMALLTGLVDIKP